MTLNKKSISYNRLNFSQTHNELTRKFIKDLTKTNLINSLQSSNKSEDTRPLHIPDIKKMHNANLVSSSKLNSGHPIKKHHKPCDTYNSSPGKMRMS